MMFGHDDGVDDESIFKLLDQFQRGEKQPDDIDALRAIPGEDVLKKQKVYSVFRAIRFFLSKGIACVVVCRRDQLIEDLHAQYPDGVEVIKAERTDDVILLQTAMKKNCPIVSRDAYSEWRSDWR